ncbi:ABC transporter B family member 2 [Cytospora mali]|uniref:ABC transporter B family member 2 n=1 Tax=Cytospora mali TaxID=578113 RepID=A0A194VQP9_CYTMA|nr:ABC transporter B family member 2 [Valsa mali]
METAKEDADGSTNLPKTGRQSAAKTEHEREASWGDYFRVFTYAKRWDYFLMVMAAVAALGSGVTMPLMNVIFGRLVGGFTTYGDPQASTMTKV